MKKKGMGWQVIVGIILGLIILFVLFWIVFMSSGKIDSILGFLKSRL